MFAEDIQHEETPSTAKPIALALQNKLGSSLLCALLHRGEKIYSTESPVDLDSSLQNEWYVDVRPFSWRLSGLRFWFVVVLILYRNDQLEDNSIFV